MKRKKKCHKILRRVVVLVAIVCTLALLDLCVCCCCFCFFSLTARSSSCRAQSDLLTTTFCELSSLAAVVFVVYFFLFSSILRLLLLCYPPSLNTKAKMKSKRLMVFFVFSHHLCFVCLISYCVVRVCVCFDKSCFHLLFCRRTH